MGHRTGRLWNAAEHVVVACSAISGVSRRRAERRLPETPILPVPDVADRNRAAAADRAGPELPGLICGWLPPARCGAEPSSCTPPGQRRRTAGPADRAGLRAVGHPPGYDLHRLTGTSSVFPKPVSGSPPPTTSAMPSASRWFSRSAGDRSVREDARTSPRCPGAWQQPHRHPVADASPPFAPRWRDKQLLGQEMVGDAPGGSAERILGPLARAALDNTLQRGQAALTGPVARGDAPAVAAHPKCLNDVDPLLAQAYCADSLRTAQRAQPRGGP